MYRASPKETTLWKTPPRPTSSTRPSHVSFSSGNLQHPIPRRERQKFLQQQLVRNSSSAASSSSSHSLLSKSDSNAGTKKRSASEEEEESWAFGGGSHSRGNFNQKPRESIEFVVSGSAGKGAIPNYGRRKPNFYDAEDKKSNKDRKLEESYTHNYAPTSRSPRPLPHHTYFSSPSSSFNDDAAATAAGTGPVGVGGPRSGLGMGAGMHFSGSSIGHNVARKKTALILPGQGSQYVGMTLDIFRKYRSARQVWNAAEDALIPGFGSTRRGRDYNAKYSEDLQKRTQFEEELNKSAAWDPTRNMPGDTAIARARRGWLRDLVFSGDQLNLTRAENAQPSILVASLSILSALRHEFSIDLIADHIDYVAGHGSGVYAALCAMDLLDIRDSVRLLRHRGLTSSHFVYQNKVLFPDGSTRPDSIYETWAFANAGSGKGAELLATTNIGIEAGGVPPSSLTSDASVVEAESEAEIPRGWKRTQMSGCMIRPGKLQEALHAVKNISQDIKSGRVERVAKDEVVEVANINSNLQIVLSGTRVGVSLASDKLRQLNLGARAVNLPVSGPYHSSLMREAAEFLKPSIESLPLLPHSIDQKHGSMQLISCLEGAKVLPDNTAIREDLSGALAKPVMWLQSIEKMVDRGVQRFICLGPGRACAHLLSKELAFCDRRSIAEGKAPGEFEVWSINSVEDVEQIGSILGQLSAEKGTERPSTRFSDDYVAL